MDKAEKNDGNFIEMEGSEASDSTGYRYLGFFQNNFRQ